MSSPGALASGTEKGAAALSVQGLGKRFGDRAAFADVSFEIGYGEVFGFLGPNGAGKTTTVRTLGTLLAPTSGSATVAGIPLAPENGVEIRRRIAIMPESPGLYLRLTVARSRTCTWSWLTSRREFRERGDVRQTRDRHRPQGAA
jgi:ABC-2 type transport system ATP-binding protein